jgi:hypothetical protein
MTQHIQDFCEDRARKGEGAFAVAFALLELARAQDRTATALKNLGNGDAATPMGAIEALGAVLKDGAEQIADAISGLRPD